MQLIEQTYVMSHVVHLSIPPRRYVNSRAAITNFVRRVGKGGGEGRERERERGRGRGQGQGRGRRRGRLREEGVGGRKIHAYHDVTAYISTNCFEISSRDVTKKIKRVRDRHVNRYCVILELFIASWDEENVCYVCLHTHTCMLREEERTVMEREGMKRRRKRRMRRGGGRLPP